MTRNTPLAALAPFLYTQFCLSVFLLAQPRLSAAPGPSGAPPPCDNTPIQCPNLMVCSPDGRFYVAAAPDGRLKYCRAEDGKTVLTFYHCSPRGLIFSRDGRFLVCAGGFEAVSGSVRVWNLSSGRPLCSFQTALAEVPALAISANGLFLALTTGPRQVGLYELPQGTARWSVSLKSTVAKLSFAEQDGAVLVRGEDNSLELLALSDGQLRHGGAGSR
jgi:WD40 repeat protein